MAARRKLKEDQFLQKIQEDTEILKANSKNQPTQNEGGRRSRRKSVKYNPMKRNVNIMLSLVAEPKEEEGK